VLDMKRWLPSSAQLVAALNSDDTVLDVRQAETIEDLGEVEHVPTDEVEVVEDVA
jgi:hypothetical protein